MGLSPGLRGQWAPWGFWLSLLVVTWLLLPHVALQVVSLHTAGSGGSLSTPLPNGLRLAALPAVSSSPGGASHASLC